MDVVQVLVDRLNAMKAVGRILGLAALALDDGGRILATKVDKELVDFLPCSIVLPFNLALRGLGDGGLSVFGGHHG